MKLFALTVLAFSLFGASKTYKSYLSYELITASPTTAAQRKILYDSIAQGQADPISLNHEKFELLMKKENVEYLEKIMPVTVKKTGEEIMKFIDSTRRGPETRHSVDWLHYNTLDEIYEFMNETAEANPLTTTLSVLAQSWEGRDVLMLTIDNDPQSTDRRPLILIDAGIHAREWVTPATATYVIDNLVRDESLMNMAVYVVIASLNPDGYAYSWESDRLWRKTRSTHPGNLCVGVDGNRNFDFMWMEVGASDNPCSSTYAGPYPLSEPEYNALANLMIDNIDRLKAYITIHSYGQLILYPFGHTTVPAENAAELDRVAGLAADAIFQVEGSVYEYGSTASILYLNSGTSRDYALGALGVNYSYTYELRDTGETGFELPEDQIMGTAMEAYEGIKAMIAEALNTK